MLVLHNFAVARNVLAFYIDFCSACTCNDIPTPIACLMFLCILQLSIDHAPTAMQPIAHHVG